jgi:hypothetical protein
MPMAEMARTKVVTTMVVVMAMVISEEPPVLQTSARARRDGVRQTKADESKRH